MVISDYEYKKKLSDVLNTIFEEQAIGDNVKKTKSYNTECDMLESCIEDSDLAHSPAENLIFQNDDNDINGYSENFVIDHFDYIKYLTQKLKFTTSAEEWEKGYIFSKEKGSINSSREKSLEWLEKVLSRSGDGPNVISGPVGSGKSSFIKYLIVTCGDSFFARKVIPCRVELSVIKEALVDVESRSEWISKTIDTIVIRLIRDILLNFVCRGWDKKLHLKDGFLQNFSQWSKNTISASRILRDISEERPLEYDQELLAQAISVSSAGNACTTYISDMSDIYKALVIKYVEENLGFRFLIIFDGFDAIKPFEHFGVCGFHDILNVIVRIMKTRFNNRFSTYSRKRNVNFSVNIRASFLILFRENTIHYFRQSWGIEDGADRPHVDYVKTPKFTEIIDGRIKAKSINIISEDEAAIAEVNGATTAMARVLRGTSIIAAKILMDVPVIEKEDFSLDKAIKSGEDLSDFFNNNIRVCLEYFHVILKYVLVSSVRMPVPAGRTRSIKSLNFSYEFISNSMVLAQKKRYKFIKALLIGLNETYHNFSTVTENNISLEVYGKQICRGMSFPQIVRSYGTICDNVLNYHRRFEVMLDSDPTAPCIFEKVRILQILSSFSEMGVREQDRYATVKQVVERMRQNFGHKYPNIGDFYFTLQSLIYSELVTIMDNAHNYPVDEHKLKVKITNVGMHMINKISHRIEYIEHVSLRTRLPKSIRDIMIIEKTGAGIVSNKNWRIAAINNFYVFYQYSKWVEKVEKSLAPNAYDIRIHGGKVADYSMVSKMRLNIGAIEAMITSNDKKFFSGHNVEWNAEFLLSVGKMIKESNEKLKNIQKM